jgi:Retroviral aspartyl protease
MERVLIDTGATASILRKDYIRHIKTDTKAEALMYDGTRLTIYKTESRVYLHIGSKKQSWEFRVSETSTDVILGMDWIEQNIYNISFADWKIITYRKTFDAEPQKEIPELEEIKKNSRYFYMSKNIYLHITLTIANLYSNLMLKNSNNTH